jgi:DNA-binding transcriptional regulator YiaG
MALNTNETQLQLKDQSPSLRARSKTALTQEEFARKYGIPINTVRNHDQSRSTPAGAASIYYLLIEEFPDQIAEMVEKVLK